MWRSRLAKASPFPRMIPFQACRFAGFRFTPMSPNATAIVAYLALFATVGFLFVLASLILGWFLRARAPTAQKLETYECGEPAVGPGSVQFDLRFYVVALVFLIFEVEVAFFFPPATVFGRRPLMAARVAQRRAVTKLVSAGWQHGPAIGDREPSDEIGTRSHAASSRDVGAGLDGRPGRVLRRAAGRALPSSGGAATWIGSARSVIRPRRPKPRRWRRDCSGATCSYEHPETSTTDCVARFRPWLLAARLRGHRSVDRGSAGRSAGDLPLSARRAATCGSTCCTASRPSIISSRTRRRRPRSSGSRTWR